MANGKSKREQAKVGEMVRFHETESGLRPLAPGENMFQVPTLEVVAVQKGLLGTQVVTLRPVGRLAEALEKKGEKRLVKATLEPGWRERK